MADIKIGSKTYNGITTLRVLLSDGSGYAIFKYDSETGGVTFDSYEVFVPQNVSDEWNTGGTGSSAQAKTLNISTSEFLELFYDGFVSTPPEGLTVAKTSIGKDQSGQYDMWEYDFKPTNYSRTILLSSGMHTYELSASFGLANFIGHLYTDTDNEAFEYIRKNVRVKVIPIVNPWGFNQSPKKYGNVNGVNPNRNFDLNGQWSSFPVYTPSQNEWNVKGDYPFSEAEAINLAKWAINNYNAEFWIDCHTGLGYADSDLWIYYSSDSVILDRINNAISKIETWFKEAYGSTCVTKRTVDNEGSIRLHWAEKIVGLAGFTLEQAPGRTTFGTANNNDSGDISNYSTNISTFIQEFLLEKYRDNSVVKITSVSANDVEMANDELSKTVEVTIAPTNTTQNHFEWTSSDESVVEVYGGTNKAVLVNKGTGTATITLTNRYNPSITASFNVTVSEQSSGGESGGEEELITRYINGYISSVGEHTTVDTNFYTSKDFVDVSSRIIEFNIPSDIHGISRIMVAEYNDDGVFIQRQASPESLTDNSYKFVLDSNTAMIKYCLRSISWSNTILNRVFDETYSIVSFVDEEVEQIGAGIRAIDLALGNTVSSTKRITTDFIEVESLSNVSANIVNDGYYIKAIVYTENGELDLGTMKSSGDYPYSLGTFTTSSFTENVSENAKYIRLLIKKSNDSDITSEEMLSIIVELNGKNIKFVETTEIQSPYEFGANIKGISVDNGTLIDNNARITTEPISIGNVVGTYKVECDNGYYIKAFVWNPGGQYNSAAAFGNLSTNSITSANTKNYFIRILFKKADGSDFTQEELLNITGTINGQSFKLKLDENI